ncbi:MAG: MFS transporter [Stellaceae bacterium]
MSLEPPGPVPALPPRTIHLFLLQRFAGGIAMQMQAVAVGWYVYALTSSPLDLGFIGLVQFVPAVGLALVAGHVIDRYPRRFVLLGAQALELACYIALAAVAYTGIGSIGLVFLIVAGLGVARAFDSPAQASLLPGLVPTAAFPRAAAWSSMATQASVVLGPAAGGLIYILGEAVPFAVAAALASVAMLAVFCINERHVERASAPLSWKTLSSGIDFIRHHQAVLGAISLDLFGVLFGGATALLPIFARDILMIGPVGLGLMRSAPAVGALTTGLILTRWPLSRHIGTRMLIAVAIFGVATLIFGVSRWTPLSFAALICVGASDMVSVVTRNTLVQTETPDAIRGRVSAVNTVFIGTSNQLGEFESGLTAAWFGPVGSVVLGGVATVLIAGLWAWRLPALRRMDRFNTAAR